MPTDNHTTLVAVAQAEDTFDLLNHIAWTDVILPKLSRTRDQYTKAVVNNILGGELPPGVTREQCASRAYGIDYAIQTLESILSRGEKALEELNHKGISL